MALSHVHRFAALLSATAPLAEPPAAEFAGTLLIVSGAADPIVPAENAARLAVLLESAGAAVRHETVPSGHTLSHSDVALAKAWIEGR